MQPSEHRFSTILKLLIKRIRIIAKKIQRGKSDGVLGPIVLNLSWMPDATTDVHPDYNDEDADLLIASGDGQKFRVHSHIMTRASGVFKTMINMGPEQASPNEAIKLPEDREIIKGLLDIIYPDKPPLSSIPDFARFKDLCYAAEKYEMIGVLSTLRLVLQSVGKCYPTLPAYALAARYEWKDELRWLSTKSLSINLFSPEWMADIRGIPSDKLMELMCLHRERRDLMVASVKYNQTQRLSIRWADATSDKKGCPHFQTYVHRLTVLEHPILEEMERHPDGSTIRESKFWDRAEFKRIWSAKCKICGGVARPLIDKNKLRLQVMKILDELPNSISVW